MVTATKGGSGPRSGKTGEEQRPLVSFVYLRVRKGEAFSLGAWLLGTRSKSPFIMGRERGKERKAKSSHC